MAYSIAILLIMANAIKRARMRRKQKSCRTAETRREKGAIMSAFEIAITVLLSFITTGFCALFMQAFVLLGRVIERFDKKEKPASENETDEQ